MRAAGVEGCLAVHLGKKEAAGSGKGWENRLCEWEGGGAKGEHIAPEIRQDIFLKFLSQQNPWNEHAAVCLKEREDIRLNATQS